MKKLKKMNTNKSEEVDEGDIFSVRYLSTDNSQQCLTFFEREQALIKQPIVLERSLRVQPETEPEFNAESVSC